MPRYATIISTGRYLPPIERSNDDLRPLFGEVVDKFQKASSIRTRFYAPDGCATSDLAVEAARDALKEAGLKPEDLDMVILGTDSPDYVTPATSVVVQHKLGAVKAGTFDVGCACASFPTGLNLAAGLISANPHVKYVLVIGAYMMHKLADTQGDVMSFYYGDGAGAAILTADSKPGFVSSTFFADGSYHQYWGIYSGGTYEPAYQGPFLPDCRYEDWAAPYRERLAELYLKAAGQLAAHGLACQEWDQASAISLAALHQDPYWEPAYRQLIQAYIGLGNYSQAQATYNRCAEVLQRELGIEPSPETRALLAQIRA